MSMCVRLSAFAFWTVIKPNMRSDKQDRQTDTKCVRLRHKQCVNWTPTQFRRELANNMRPSNVWAECCASHPYGFAVRIVTSVVDAPRCGCEMRTMPFLGAMHQCDKCPARMHDALHEPFVRMCRPYYMLRCKRRWLVGVSICSPQFSHATIFRRFVPNGNGNAEAPKLACVCVASDIYFGHVALSDETINSLALLSARSAHCEIKRTRFMLRPMYATFSYTIFVTSCWRVPLSCCQ